MPSKASRSALWVVAALVAAILLCRVPVAHAKGIHVTVEASWNETSFLQEGCEWAARSLGDRAFFACVDALWGSAASPSLKEEGEEKEGHSLATAHVDARSSSQQTQYAAMQGVAQQLADTHLADMALFTVEMSSRVYAPAVEAHYAIAAQTLAEVTATSTAADLLCVCGEPFGVVYTIAASSDGALRTHLVCSAADLAQVKASLQRSLMQDLDSSVASSSHARRRVAVTDVTLPRLDHHYPHDGALSVEMAGADAVLVLYGLLGSSRLTWDLHAAATAWIEETASAGSAGPTLAYVYRHLPVSRSRLCGNAEKSRSRDADAQWDSPMAVQGYGVTVDIKNREYKVLDEKAAAQQRAKEAASGSHNSSTSGVSSETTPLKVSDDYVVAGFHIARLKERHAHLASALDAFTTLMEEDVGGSASDAKVDFDVWELQSIGLAAAQYIREVENSSRRLHVLRDVVTRFPLYAATLSRLAAQPGRLEVVQKTLTTAQLPLPPGTSALFVDGWRVEEKDLSLFGVLAALRADESVAVGVKRTLTTHVAAAAPRTIATVPVDPDTLERISAYVKRTVRRAADALTTESTTAAALAIPSAHVTWLNDVEAEPRYDGMSERLDTFFTQIPGVTPFPRRNLLNFVLLLNPMSRSNLQSMTIIYRFNQQGLIARYGLMLVDPNWSPEIAPDAAGREGQASGFDGPSSLSPDVVALSALAYHLAAAGQPHALLNVLMAALQASARTTTTTASDAVAPGVIEELCERYAESVLKTPLAELMADVDFLSSYHETQAVLRRFAMAEYPATLLNGQLLDLSQLNVVLQHEVTRMREWVAAGDLTDDTDDLYTAMLQLRGAADHLQPALLRPPLTMSWATSPDEVAFVESAAYMFSAAYAMDLPSLTQVIALPCRTATTTATLRQLLTVLSALQACGNIKAETDAFGAVCRRLRVSVAACPGDVSPVGPHVAALLHEMDAKGVAEEKRYATVQRYIAHILRAVEASADQGGAANRSSSSSGGGAVVDAETVAAALERDPLPDDLHVDADPQRHHRHASSTATAAGCNGQRGLHDFWAALDAVAPPTKAADVTVMTNGRVVVMDASFTAADVLMAAQQMLPLSRVVEEAVLKVNFAEMASVGGYAAEELDNAFYGCKIACLASVFDAEMNTHTAKRTAAVAREEALFATAEDRKRLRPLLFTVSNTPTTSAAGSEEADNAEERVQGGGANAASVTARGGSVHAITAVVDPSSRDAQVVVALASFLLQSPLRLRLTVLLNPSLDVHFPIRDFYEYVASTAVAFDNATGRVVPPAAAFSRLPATALLTLGVEEPPSWTVFSQEAEEDLDNILLSKLTPGTTFVFAVYRMHSLLVTGDSTDAVTGGPPDGLPLSLTPAAPPRTAAAAVTGGGGGGASTRSTDTQVMANQHGYYQLQATPGLWYLSIKPGPIATAYCIESVEHQPEETCADGQRRDNVNFTAGQRIPVVVDSFTGRYLSLRVRHTPPAATTASNAAGGGSTQPDLHAILQRMAADVTHTWPPPWRQRGAQPHPPPKPTLNIFSVASGHLYERFLRMMFYSVHKTSADKYGANTTRIKFWVIENFLSPQFKRYIPLLAEQLGFEVGFVTYRWPWWLPRQTEKQRKIWAYKILFLDVLFPLDVDRIIFVDADQTAQSDLHELYNMDISHHPVAMTPFCQTFRNEDTVRFRFWEQGFWVNHLKGKPYHISAIFLVDLRQFRAMLAGDRYRATYASLSSDPNSLSNLDQDLPNFLQASIPIFSLPEQWLWCETWCSAKSKSKAKTIDLCNNPLTKMPKLDNAKMVIPGWEELDNKLQNMSDALLHHS